jgi:hypothetical protein
MSWGLTLACLAIGFFLGHLYGRFFDRKGT